MNNLNIVYPSDPHEEPKPRRRFVSGFLLSMVGVKGLSNVEPDRTSPDISLYSTPEPARVPAGMEYLRPQSLPKGFRFLRAAVNELAGFGPDSSNNEVTMFYGNPKVPYRSGLLRVVCTTEPRGPFFLTQVCEYHLLAYGLEQQPAVAVPVVLPSGSIVTASYFESILKLMPRLPVEPRKLVWDNANGHAVVLQVNKFSVGIFGYRRGGIGRDELVRIAGSLELHRQET